jgi:hypothetical protein
MDLREENRQQVSERSPSDLRDWSHPDDVQSAMRTLLEQGQELSVLTARWRQLVVRVMSARNHDFGNAAANSFYTQEVRPARCGSLRLRYIDARPCCCRALTSHAARKERCSHSLSSTHPWRYICTDNRNRDEDARGSSCLAA